MWNYKNLKVKVKSVLFKNVTFPLWHWEASPSEVALTSEGRQAGFGVANPA